MLTLIEEISNRLVDNARIEEPRALAQWIRKYPSKCERAANQFIVFLKPEATALQEGVDIRGILSIVFDAFHCWNVHIGAIRILNARYLQQYRIIERHYEVINSISTLGMEALSASTRATLEQEFGNELREGASVLGGHQFLRRFPEISPFALFTFLNNLGPKKIASGIYCLPLRVKGKTILILNAFHPFQMENYTAQGRAIIVFEAWSMTPWLQLRHRLLGATNPVRAARGSIRHAFSIKQAELGLAEVDQSSNGIHLSAGPLEGMVELCNFCSDYEHGQQLDFGSTNFGRLLLSMGCPPVVLEKLAENPYLKCDGEPVSVFDLTEERESYNAAEQLMQCLRKEQLFEANS